MSENFVILTLTLTKSKNDVFFSSPSIDGSSNGNSRSSFGVPPSVAAKVWMTAQKGLRTFINEKAEAMTVSLTSHSSNTRKDNGNGNYGENESFLHDNLIVKYLKIINVVLFFRLIELK